MGYDTAYDNSRNDARDILADAERNGYPASMSTAVIGIGHAILALAEAVKHNADRRQ